MTSQNFTKLMMYSLISVAAFGETTQKDRLKLPIAEKKTKTYKELDARNVERPTPHRGIEAPEGAPNILIIMLDDFGYGQSSTFGGPIDMPNLTALSKEGLLYNQFHTTAVSSATRTALLTGRNHHMNNMGAISEAATAFPGNTGERPQNISTVAKILEYNGYVTGMFGKAHEIPAWQSGPAGSQKLWPTDIGFDKFYGFFGGETDQYEPVLVDGITRISTPRGEGYHFTEDLTNKTNEWINLQKSYNKDKPFFAYYVPGAVHAPHQVFAEWSDKYKGKFDKGWDEVRKETFKRQKELGIIPKDTVLTDMPDYIERWDSLTDKEKKIYAREMEIYAGYATHTDNEIGKIIQNLKDIGEYDNTLIFYIAGDNGPSGEGNRNGTFNSLADYNGVAESLDELYKNIDKLGTPESFGHYAAGWAVAGSTPFAWTKVMASDYGGVANGMVVSWKNGIKTNGEIRSQWTHVIDVTPTILEVANIPQPKTVDGLKQEPIQGKSFFSTFESNSVKETRHTQYFEIGGNRAIYDDGWFARVIHTSDWYKNPFNTLENDKWELFNTKEDFSLSNDLSEEYPKRLKKMIKLFEKEAIKNHVYPLDDRTNERMNAEIAGRPDALFGKKIITLYEGATGIPENSFINIKNKSYTITAKLDVEDPKNTNGVIVAQGGRFAGWSLFVKDGYPVHEYNWLNYERPTIKSDTMLKKGENTVTYVFKYDPNGTGGKGNKFGTGKGGEATMFLNGKKVGVVKINNTVSTVFSFDDGGAIGEDEGGPASNQYESPFKYNSKIKSVTIDTSEEGNK